LLFAKLGLQIYSEGIFPVIENLKILSFSFDSHLWSGQSHVSRHQEKIHSATPIYFDENQSEHIYKACLNERKI